MIATSQFRIGNMPHAPLFSKLDRATICRNNTSEPWDEVVTHVPYVLSRKLSPGFVGSLLHNLDAGVRECAHALHQMRPEGVVQRVLGGNSIQLFSNIMKESKKKLLKDFHYCIESCEEYS